MSLLATERPARRGVIPPLFRWLIPAALAAGLVAAGFWLHASDTYGRAASWALLSGAVFGFVLQRSRFCFYCGLREWIEERDNRAALGLIAALAVGTLGYLVVFGAWVPFPEAGHLPPRAHLGPAGWHLLAGGFSFGLGMALSGSCLSAHLYRLGEGSLLAPVALLGAVGGFILGFNTWAFFYVNAVTEAPVLWLPQVAHGYALAAPGQLLVLGGLAAWVWRRGRKTTPEDTVSAPLTWRALGATIFVTRWPRWVGGVLVGLLGAVVYLRATPLGVTAELGRLSRKLGAAWELSPVSLPGLDGLAGCATGDTASGALTPNALFVLGLVTAALASGVVSREFDPEKQSWVRVLLALAGGVLLGFGSMISLGCTIGTLLSGIHALAVSGWIFAAALYAGVWSGIKLRRALGQ